MSLETRLAAFAARAAQEDKALRDSVADLTGQWAPSDIGCDGWAYDPAAAASSQLGAGGVLYLTRIPLRQAATISSVWFYVNAAGAALANVGVALYTAAGALLASTVNAGNATPAQWQTVGLKQVAITPQAVAAGAYYAGYWATGTTQPGMLRAAATGPGLNIGTVLAGGTGLRFAAANTGLTTVAPAQAVQTGNSHSTVWAAMA